MNTMSVTCDTELVQKKFPIMHIADLMTNNQDTSSFMGNISASDFAFLTDLVELNSNNDQVHKRILDSSQPTPFKLVKTRKKTVGLVCVVCSGQASGLHYGIVTYSSCKAFFSCNTRLPLGTIRCLYGKGKCPFFHRTRRKCSKCRLKRCFSMGMRLNNVFTHEKKQRRRKTFDEDTHHLTAQISSTESDVVPEPLIPSIMECLSQTPDNIDLFLMNIDNNDLTAPFYESIHCDKMNNPSLHFISVKDWLDIQSIESSYLLAFRHEPVPCTYNPYDPSSVICYWSQVKNQIALNLITFFRRVDRFKDLNGDDRFTLVKYNFLNLLILHKYSNFDPLLALCSDLPNEVQYSFYQWVLNCLGGRQLVNMLLDLMHSFVKATEQEPILLRLVLVMLLFSTDTLMNEDKVRLNDSLVVYRAQCHYTTLLWNYLIDKQGEKKAIRQFTQLIDVTMRMQFITRKLKDVIRMRLISSNTVDRLTPLIQSALNIS